MSPLDLIRSRDGSMSQTKLAAACFHFSLFVTVGFITYITRQFNESMWLIYMTAAVGHATYDKTIASVKSFKDRKLELDAGAASDAHSQQPNT
jgi:hypothetical protein